jgi:hypothetical protein
LGPHSAFEVSKGQAQITQGSAFHQARVVVSR